MKFEDVLPREGHRPPGKTPCELPEGHEAAGERHAPEEHLEAERDRAEESNLSRSLGRRAGGGSAIPDERQPPGRRTRARTRFAPASSSWGSAREMAVPMPPPRSIPVRIHS